VKNVRATSSERPRQAYLGASKIRLPGSEIFSVGGRCCGQELDQGGQSALETNRLRGAHDDLMFVYCERISFIESAAISGRDAYRRRERCVFVPGRKLDPDGRSIRPRVANRRHNAQPRASRDLQAEPLDDRRNVSIGVSDDRA